MTKLSNGRITFFTEGEYLGNDVTPNFNSEHVQYQLIVDTPSLLFRVEVWAYNPRFGYSMRQHFLSKLSVNTEFLGIREAVNHWMVDSVDPNEIVKELEIPEESRSRD